MEEEMTPKDELFVKKTIEDTANAVVDRALAGFEERMALHCQVNQANCGLRSEVREIKADLSSAKSYAKGALWTAGIFGGSSAVAVGWLCVKFLEHLLK